VADAAAAGGLADDAESYFQRRAPGRSHSMLFLADGRHARIVGISRQITRAGASRRYAYAGAVGPVGVPAQAARTLADALQALVAHTGLVGCNSIDFMLDGARPAVLEINPRPSATIDLYDADWPRGLFDAHVQACRGRLPAASRVPAAAAVRAHRVLYTGTGLRIGDAAVFEAWCSDLPRSGSRIAADAPVCTVHAGGTDVPAALRQLARRRRRIETALALQHDSEETHEFDRSAPERESECGPAGRIAAGAPPRAAAGGAPA
jgi:predicted ATP-grasp superfamily ATP-dependent carboligase